MFHSFIPHANVVTNLAAYSCGELHAPMGLQAEVEFNANVQTVASAMAQSAASVLATCDVQGDTSGTVGGLAKAKARAEADGRATVDIIGTADVCNQCNASLDLFTEVARTVSATAVAEAELEVCSGPKPTMPIVFTDERVLACHAVAAGQLQSARTRSRFRRHTTHTYASITPFRQHGIICIQPKSQQTPKLTGGH